MTDESEETCSAFPILAARLSQFVTRSLAALADLNAEALVSDRYAKFRAMGRFGKSAELETRRDAPAVATAARPRKVDPTPPLAVLRFIAEQTIFGPYSHYKGKAPASAVSRPCFQIHANPIA